MLEQLVGKVRREHLPLITMYTQSGVSCYYYSSSNYANQPGVSPVQPYYFDGTNAVPYITQAGTGKYGETTIALLESNSLLTYPNFDNNGAFNATSEFSWEGWIKFGGNSSGQYRLFGLGQYTSSSGTNYVANLYYQGSNLTFNVFPCSNTNASQYAFNTYINTQITNTNAWNHIAVESYGGSFYYYMNGVLFGTQPYTFATQSINTICFGRIFASNDTAYQYNGSMYGIIYHPAKALRKANFNPNIPPVV